jgi:hypothetical protein
VRITFEVVGADKQLGVSEVKELTEGKHTEPSLRIALATLVEEGFLKKSKGGHNRDIFQLAISGSVENTVGFD